MDFSGLLGPKPALPPVEVAMQATETILGADRYRVEVSGWDEEEMFFVEKSHLDWDEFAGKHITLRHMLPEGAIVFVRMLQPTEIRQSPPMAYKVNSSCVIRRECTSFV